MAAPSPPPPLGAALASFRAGDLAAAESGIRAALAVDPSDPKALHLGGEIAARAGDLDLAAARLESAARAAAAPDVLASLARVRWRCGESAAALSVARRSLALRPAFVPALLVEALALFASGDRDGCRRSLAATGLPDADPMTVEFAFQAIAEIVRDGRRVFSGAPEVPSDASPLSLTVVTCSVDEAKLARCRAALRASLPPGLEHLEIRAPRSLASAYNEALAAARGEAIVFLHDDVEVLSPRLDLLLARSLARADVVGVAGTRRLEGPTLGWAGQREMRGWLVHGSSASATWDFSVLALRAGLETGIQALDGCFIAARTQAARAVGFDAATFDGFHFYDLDFCLRAHRAGLAVAVDTGILVAHASRGSLGPAWQAQAERFAAKFPPLGRGRAQPSHFHAARLADADEAKRLQAELEGFCAALGTREP
jgi:hypothetical protein